MKPGDIIPWDGRSATPDTGGHNILVRLRCRTWEDVERQQKPSPPSAWRKWWHDGGAGDIVAFKIV